MAGIYIHIPFCKKACHYCNFHFSTSLKTKNDFVEALLKEISMQSNYLEGESVETIYLGGGTPSLLEKQELQIITESLFLHFNIQQPIELTLEANPDDITAEKLNHWKQIGINRLSIGVQSFFDNDLLWMNRAHMAAQATSCIKLAQNAGFHNLSIDLIYGGPTLTDDNWLKNIATAIAFNIPHLSCYALTVEPGTALQKMIATHKMDEIDSDKQARHFLMLEEQMGKAGFEHYEISNFAKPGLRSRHNSSYWQGKKYLGLGPSAHSFNGNARQWNIANNALYIQSLKQNSLAFETEVLTPQQHLNEYIMTSLRTIDGIDLSNIEKRFGENAVTTIQQAAVKYIEGNKLYNEDRNLRLTKEGKLFADGIAADLFFNTP